jgi:putative protease
MGESVCLMSTVELLAPAGTIETFHAALDAGADAVYVGAPGFNARNLAKDLRIEEIAAMIQYCRKIGKKIYIAANSLILERELEQVIETLALLEELQPDALIVQDFGLVHLVKKYFPSLKLHGSTLMTAHNSDGITFLQSLGFERVVLARELTLKEIETVEAKSGSTELEVFVHGAMCFSYSGLCLFSSYLGGKSGLRGRCVQPCRRGYSSSGKKGKGRSKGGEPASKYLFSMNDLNGLDAVGRLKELGITSLKIEGRLRSANYVRSIVEAYRIILDSDKDNAETQLDKANLLVERAMGRKTSPGYFFTPQPLDAITPYHSGNMGIHLGRFSTTKKVSDKLTCKFTTKSVLEAGDRLRLHIEPSGERTALRVKTLFVTGTEQVSAQPGEKVSIELPRGFDLQSGAFVEVYKTDGASSSSGHRKLLDVKGNFALLEKRKKQVEQRSNHVFTAMYPNGIPEEQEQVPVPVPTKGRRSQGKVRKKIGIEWWLKTDSIHLVLGKVPFSPDRYLLTLDKELLSQVGRIKSELGRRSRLVSWVLPPVIMENDLRKVRKQVGILLRSGFRSFQLSHISQVQLFRGEKVHLFGEYSLNLMNSQALQFCNELGFDGSLCAIEMDRGGIQELMAGCKGVGRAMPTGLYVYGAPPLYTARLSSKHIPLDQQIMSPRKEPYIIKKKEGFTQTFPEKPFSLLPYLDEIKEAGINYVLVDTCGHSSKKNMEELTDRLANNGRYPKLPTFNYMGNLE